MSKRRSLFLLGIASWVALVSTPLSAAPQRLYLPADVRDARKLVEDRKTFIREVYQVNDAAAAEADRALVELQSAQERYESQSRLTLDRLRLTISIVANDLKRSAEDRNKYVQRFQSQYHTIVARAPLSLQNAVRVAEAALPKDVVTAGRARIAEKFAGLAREMGLPADPTKLDAIVVGPIKPGAPPQIALPPRPVATPPQTESPRVKIEPVSTPPTAQVDATPPQPSPPTPAAKPAAPPPPPPVARGPATPQPVPPLAPAPPQAQWEESVQHKTARFEFTPEQKEQAMVVLKQTAERTAKYREQNSQAFVDAEKMTDAAAKAARIKELNRPIDLAYDQLLKRIDSIASIEQRNRAASTASASDSKK